MVSLRKPTQYRYQASDEAAVGEASAVVVVLVLVPVLALAVPALVPEVGDNYIILLVETFI